MIEFNYTILIQFFQFLLLLLLLNFLLFRPILGGLRKRRTTIESLAEKGEKSRQEALGLSRTYEESLKEKKLPLAAKREAMLKEAHAASMKVVEEARQELTQDLAKVKERVAGEAGKALEALLGESDRLAEEIAQKITKRGN
jgi:F-type H+-transporting ATPase subunit b